ncbi:MAG: hypothetical protein DRN27_08640 [Thermoplasmata archaeon]|nr:MAG: hypothetical protein DRN27_08640 [Thermoplasmata archaeon]
MVSITCDNCGEKIRFYSKSKVLEYMDNDELISDSFKDKWEKWYNSQTTFLFHCSNCGCKQRMMKFLLEK